METLAPVRPSAPTSACPHCGRSSWALQPGEVCGLQMPALWLTVPDNGADADGYCQGVMVAPA